MAIDVADILNWNSLGMDWSGSLAVPGRGLRPYISAVVKSLVERRKSLGTQQSYQSSQAFEYLEAWLSADVTGWAPTYRRSYGSPLFPVVSGVITEGGDVGRAIDKAIDEFIVDDADGPINWGGAGQNLAYACNHNDSSGNWDGVSAVRAEIGRRWDWPTMLADIGDSERLYCYRQSGLSARWLKQVYEIINRIKWVVQYRSDGFDYPTDWNTYGTTDARTGRVYGTSDHASQALAEAAANSGYDATADFSWVYSDSFDPRRKTKLIENGYGSWAAEINTWGNRISFYKAHADMDFDYDAYALFSGLDEFDDYGDGWTQDLYNRFATGSITGATGWYNQPLIGRTDRPTPFYQGTITPIAATDTTWERGWVASATVMVKKYDVTNGFQFLA